jgi:Uncharacterized conserved protein
MIKPVILRKRFIPFEIVDISGDELLYRSDKLLVTRWKAIKHRDDLYGGISFTYLTEGIKVSRFYNASGDFLYWYCDIIDVSYDKKKDMYTFEDLLVDIKLLPDGQVRVLDADELAEALEKGLITASHVCRALRILDKVLNLIYENRFPPKECSDFNYHNER